MMLQRVLVVMAGHTHYGREALQGMYRHVLSGAPWEVHYASTEEFSPTVLRLALSRWRAQGILIQITNRKSWRWVTQSGLPVVNVSGCFRDQVANVWPDNVATGGLGAQHLLACGLRSLAFCGQTDEAYSSNREAGFQAAAAQAGVPTEHFDIHTSVGTWDWHRDHLAMLTWLRALPKPVGVMACNDFVARLVMWACNRGGIQVPDEVALLGVDNSPFEAALCRVPLSSVEMPARLIGKRAAELLEGLMQRGGRGHKPCLMLPPVGVVARASSAACPASDPALAPALRHIREHLAEPLPVTALARLCGMSLRWFNARFVRAVGHTPNAVIVRMRIERAKTLLADTETKITQVHTTCGFGQYSYFCRLFRARTGMTPGAYRRCFPPRERHTDGYTGTQTER